ncbi:GNAT family N-acetyltransferase [Nocardia yunnanensis]|nr:GNAT family N-acetyltransferase [Nocardia yunnanensis]
MWSIRRATPGDGQHLRALRLQALSDAPEAFLETYDYAAGLSAAEWEARIERYRQPGKQLLVVGEANGVWCGMAGAFLDCERDSSDIALPVRPQDRWAMIWGMYTLPAERGSGLAAALCAEAFDWAATEARVDWLGLDVRDSNTRAIKFYQHEGFAVAARRFHPALNVTSLVMMRPVTTDASARRD